MPHAPGPPALAELDAAFDGAALPARQGGQARGVHRALALAGSGVPGGTEGGSGTELLNSKS